MGDNMSWLTILLFFIYTWGFGYSITRWLKQIDNFFERNIMRIGFGLATIPLIGILLSLIKIPLNWWIFLILSLILPFYDLIYNLATKRKFPKIELKFTKSNLILGIVLIIFAFTLYMYTTGAFAYPWLEDDDPWHHASSAKFIAVEKTVFAPEGDFMYLNPYPPGYDLIMGIMHQTSSSLFWTLKFFNSLIVSLGILFFYFFAKRFLKDIYKALFATFVFACIPSYLSHFIWSHSLSMTLFLVSIYCIEMINENKDYAYVLAISIAAICLTQPTKPIKFLFIYLFFITIKWISEKKINWHLTRGIVGGYLLSLVWWATRWKQMLFTGPAGQNANPLINAGTDPNIFVKAFHMLQKAFPASSGSATRPYSFDEIVFAKSQNMINNPIGIGWVVCILIVLGLIATIVMYKKILKKEYSYMLILSLWGIYAFLGFNTMTFNLPFGLYSFRFWMVFAIPAALLAAEGMWLLKEFTKKIEIPLIVVLVLVIAGVIFTSGVQKYSVNTAMWGFGQGWTSQEELNTYIWMQQNLQPDTKVFAYTAPLFVMGFDMNNCVWCDDEKEFLKNAFALSPNELKLWMKSKNYGYIVIGGRDARNFGINETTEKLTELQKSGFFQPVYGTSGAVILKVI